jgi:hypothetical protein
MLEKLIFFEDYGREKKCPKAEGADGRQRRLNDLFLSQPEQGQIAPLFYLLIRF